MMVASAPRRDEVAVKLDLLTPGIEAGLFGTLDGVDAAT
jgi:hypothetical protein